MKRVGLLLTVLLIALTAYCQVQNGLVKTNGRPNKTGTPISGVAVKSAGRSASLSGNDGTFQLSMNGMKGGDSFFLTSVTRSGYELADKNAVGRKYGFSASVPIVLTMVSKAEMEAEKQRIRNNAITSTQKKYEKKVEELEQQLEEHIITEEVFGQQLQELQAKIDQYNDLVENLAEKYARTDYDQIEGVDREICLAIEDGLFEKADSLIHTKGDIDGRHQKALEWADASKNQKAAIDKQMEQWESQEASRIRDLNNLASDYYHSFTIDVSRMNPERAVEWLAKRSELDPERFEWLIEVGAYYKVYLADYSRAKEYFDRAEKIAKKSKHPLQMMIICNELGGLHSYLHEMDKSIRYYKEMLRYAEKDRYQYFELIALAYNNLGETESEQLHDDNAMKYYEKALTVLPDTLPTKAPYIYSNMSSVYYKQYKMDQALRYVDMAIELATQSNDRLLLSTCYQNKGVFYHFCAKYQEAIRFYEMALNVKKEIFPADHPSIASCLSNIATSYNSMSRVKESMEYEVKALTMYQNIYGEKHPRVASSYNEIATMMTNAGLYDKALAFEEKSWEIYSTFYDENTERYARHCSNLGLIYDGLRQDSLSLDYYMTAQRIYELLDMKRTVEYAGICNNLATSLCGQNNYEEALRFAQQNLAILSEIRGKENDSYITGLNNLAHIYGESGDIDKAIDTYRDVEDIILLVFGRWHRSLSVNYNNVGSLYLHAKEYDKAREFFLKSLEICDTIYHQPTEMKMTILGNISMTYYNNNKWRETIPWIEKAAAIRLQLVNNPIRRYAYHSYIYDSYSKLAQSGNIEDIANFKACQDTLWFKVSVKPEGLAATKYGLDGEYIVMKYGEWEHRSVIDFEEEVIRNQSIVHTDLVAYRDGKFEAIRFDDEIVGITFRITLLPTSEAQEITAAYNEWKAGLDHP